jgi:hypothetical protein
MYIVLYCILYISSDFKRSRWLGRYSIYTLVNINHFTLSVTSFFLLMAVPYPTGPPPAYESDESDESLSDTDVDIRMHQPTAGSLTGIESPAGR